MMMVHHYLLQMINHLKMIQVQAASNHLRRMKHRLMTRQHRNLRNRLHA